MGRPECHIDPDDGDVAAFACELRRLRENAGKPSYRELANRTHYSISTLSAAAGGRCLPTLQVTLAFVRACGGDPGEWADRWRRVASAQAAIAESDSAEAAPQVLAVTNPGASPRPARWTIARVPVLALALTCLVTAVAMRLLPSAAPLPAHTSSAPPVPFAADGQDPYIHGCGHDEEALERRPMSWPNGSPYGWIALFHSAACAASWGYVYGPNSPRWTVHIVAIRVEDRVSAPSGFRGAELPNSWGNVLSTRHGCVYVEAYITMGSVQSRPAQTSCFSDAGPALPG